MTDEEILLKAIKKAIEGGWQPKHFDTLKGSYKHPEDSEFLDPLGEWHTISPLDIIYNHQFAQALWGEGQATTRYDVFPNKDGKFGNNGNVGWKSHLMFMVIADDPIQYLKDNLRD